MDRDTDSPVETDGGVKHAVEVSEGDRALWFFVYEEREGVLVEVEQDANGGAHMDAPLDSLFVSTCVLEPGALTVNVHGPALVIFSYRKKLH